MIPVSLKSSIVSIILNKKELIGSLQHPENTLSFTKMGRFHLYRCNIGETNLSFTFLLAVSVQSAKPGFLQILHGIEAKYQAEHERVSFFQ